MQALYFILGILLMSVNIHSQSLSGQVTDQSNQALVAALVYNANSNLHTHTNHLGSFTLEENTPGDTIEVSYLGYKNFTFIYKNNVDKKAIALEEAPISIDEIVISPRLNAIEVFADIDVKVQPVNSSQEVLRQVPGLFIGQHAGGGKAEQIFLRGFDIDHGTDIRLSVDGLPINMVSHAHGQGYADLHFIIPETIEQVNFGKGSYNADQGNFATAGFVDFRTKDRLSNNLIKAELGQYGTQRLMTMLSLADSDSQAGYLASEYLLSDGPFESSQNFERVNVFGKYGLQLSENHKISLLGSYFHSTWDASGQIPERAVASGSISRFGAIDDTEGGATSRANLSLSHQVALSDHSLIENQLFYSYYDFLLFSNFTFFLEDPIRGDQIMQEESRSLFGLNSSFRSFHELLGGSIGFRSGLQLRADNSNNNRLANTENRSEIINNIQFGDIREDNLGLFADANYEIGKWTINAGLRWDHFRYNYIDRLQTLYSPQTTTSAILSPKLNLLYNQSFKLQYYLKAGKGFHSNDTRVVLAQNGQEILPAAYSMDLGIITKPFRNLLLNIAVWNLFLEQEFVYVGDAGIVEPSGKSRRQGIDISGRYQFSDWIYYNLDLNYTIAEATEEPDEANRIPLAPLFTLTTGLNIKHKSGVYGGLNLRHIGDRPANEDNSIVAEGYTVVDANIGYTWNKMSFGVQIQNLLDVEWNETQFATESRLFNESAPVEEIHFTPGVPFFAKAILSYAF